MEKSRSLIFPDNFIRSPEYVNSCHLFFDELIGPPNPNYPSRESFEQMKALVERDGGPGVYEEDFNRLWNVIASYKKTQELGLLRALQPSEHFNDPHFAARISRIQSLANTDTAFRDLLWFAAQEVTVWADDGLGTKNVGLDLATERHFGVMSYGFKTITRLDWAKRNNWNIAAGTEHQYNALRAVQTAVYPSTPGGFIPLVREFMKLSVPHLVARSYEDVLELKEKLHDYLEPFKIEMRRLYFQVPQNAQINDAMDHMRAIVQREVIPKVLELERFLDSDKRRFAKHLLAKPETFATTTATLVGCITALVAKGPFFQVARDAAAMALPLTHLMGTLIRVEWDNVEAQFENPLTFAVLSQDKYAGQLGR